MYRITESDTLDGLIADLRRIPSMARDDLRAVVNEGAKVGNTVAKDNAKRSSGTHARLYPSAFTRDRATATDGASIGYSAEYGPEPRGQGELAPILERGSRNNPAHLDLARSADLIGPTLAQEVRRASEKWFWPGAE